MKKNEPKKGTWGGLTRSTEEESKAFRKALNGLSFTREEFIQYGPGIVMIKGMQVMSELRKREGEEIMSVEIHCDSCSKTITNEIWFDIMINVKTEGSNLDSDSDSYYGHYCSQCISDGKATEQLMDEYTEDLKSEEKKNENRQS